MERRVQCELLDHLEPADATAIRSRRDLRRLNAWMGQAATLASALNRLPTNGAPPLLIELGAGDGTVLLSIARSLGWPGTRAVLLDRHSLVQDSTLRAFCEEDWVVEVVQADVFDWLANSSPGSGFSVIVANLFLHHFTETQLVNMFLLASRRAEGFIAAEPRRCGTALLCSRMVGLIGCNAVTRHDAVVSVRAGFTGRELSRLWPAQGDWLMEERPAGLFSHLFTARLRE